MHIYIETRFRVIVDADSHSKGGRGLATNSLNLLL